MYSIKKKSIHVKIIFIQKQLLPKENRALQVKFSIFFVYFIHSVTFDDNYCRTVRYK